jgi:hypothetical protein
MAIITYKTKVGDVYQSANDPISSPYTPPVTDTTTGTQTTQSNQDTSVIPASNLNQQGINIQDKNTYDSFVANYNAILKGGMDGLKTGTKAEEKADTATGVNGTTGTSSITGAPKKDYVQKIKDIMGITDESTTNTADLYAQREKESGLLESKKRKNDLQARLDSIMAQSQANQLALEGQGRGIPSSIIGGQQAKMARETAIQALPLQAQLAAEQGNIEFAQERLNTLFKLETDDLDREYQRNKDLRDKAYQLASDEEKTALAQAQLKDDRAWETQKSFMKDRTDYAQEAISGGQGALATKIANAKDADELNSLIGQISGAKSNGTDMTTRQNVVFNSIIGKSNAINSADATFNVAKATAERVKADPKNAQTQLSNLYQYVKTLDANSAVREGEVSLASGTGSLLEKIQKTLESYKSGSTVGSELAIKMADEATALADAWLAESSRQQNALRSQARTNGIEQEFVDTIGYTNELNKTGSEDKNKETPIAPKDEDTFNSVMSEPGYFDNLWSALSGKK